MRRTFWLFASALLVGLTAAPTAQSTWRPTILSDNGMVATGHALASEIGLRTLRSGGNAMDAALAAWAAQGLVEPEMTGLGADMFILVYVAKTGEVKFINGTGFAPMAATVEFYKGKGGMPDEGTAVGERSRRRRGRGACRQDVWHTAARRAARAGGRPR